MKIRRLAVLFAAAVIVSIVVLIWIAHEQPEKYSGSVEKIRLGVSTPDASALIYIADNRGFFAESEGKRSNISHPLPEYIHAKRAGMIV